MADVAKGRVIGPFKREEIPFEWFRISPRFAVPKPGPKKWRAIHHLSYPRRTGADGVGSVNSYITRKWTQELARVEDVMSDVLLIASSGETPRIALSDTKGAFRQVPISYDQWNLFGMIDPLTGD